MDFSALKKNITPVILKVVLPILLAGYIYLFYRTTNTVFFKISSFIFNTNDLLQLRFFFQNNINLSAIIIYSLPGGLWLFSFSNLVLLFYNENDKKHYLQTLITLFSIVCTLELFQHLDVTDGTFDAVDLLSYSVAIIVSYRMGLKSFKKEKKLAVYKLKSHPIYLLSGIIFFFTAGIYLADVLTH